MSNKSFNPEDAWGGGPVDQSDLSTYFNLSVKLPKRIIDENSFTNISYKGSLMDGSTTQNGKTYMDTSFVDISFTDVSNGLKNRELFGVSAIDIGFDTSFHPQVSMVFTDIKGASLFKYMENKVGDNENASNTFFSSLFHFPYPQFEMTIKGYYGTPVKFDLRVMNFDASFDGNTGNYVVKVDFIGDKYGVLSDIPMSLIMIAPYRINENGKLARDPVFNTYTFENTNTQIPTFLEIAKTYNDFISLKEKTEAAKGDKTQTIKLSNGKEITVGLIESFAKKIAGNYSIVNAKNQIDIIKNAIALMQEKHKEFIDKIKMKEGKNYCEFTDGGITYKVVKTACDIFNTSDHVYVVRVDKELPETNPLKIIVNEKNKILNTPLTFSFSDGTTENPLQTVNRVTNIIRKDGIGFFIDNWGENFHVSLNDLNDNIFTGSCTDGDVISLRRALYEQNTGKVSYENFGEYIKLHHNSGLNADDPTASVYVWDNGEYVLNKIGQCKIIYGAKKKCEIDDNFFNTENISFNLRVSVDYDNFKLHPLKDAWMHSEYYLYRLHQKMDSVSSSALSGKGVTMAGDITYDYFEKTDFFCELRTLFMNEVIAKKNEYYNSLNFYIIPCNMNFESLDKLSATIDSAAADAAVKGTFSSLDFFKECFGFKPTLPNITEIVFAHIDYFFVRLKGVYEECFKYLADRTKPENIETDTKGINFLPPYTLVAEKKFRLGDYAIEKTYPAILPHFKKPESGVYLYPDVDYIEIMYTIIRKYGYDVSKIFKKKGGGGDIQFVRLIPSDCLLDQNPYSEINVEGVDKQIVVNEIAGKLAYRMAQCYFFSNYKSVMKFLVEDTKSNLKPFLQQKCDTELILYLKRPETCFLINSNYAELLKNGKVYFENKNSSEKIGSYKPNSSVVLYFMKKMNPFGEEYGHWVSSNEGVTNLTLDGGSHIPSFIGANDITYMGDTKDNILVNAATYMLSKMPTGFPACFSSFSSGDKQYIKLKPYMEVNGTEVMQNIANIRLFWILKLGAYGVAVQKPKYFAKDMNGTNYTLSIDESILESFKQIFLEWVNTEDKYEICNGTRIWGFKHFFEVNKEKGGLKIVNNDQYDEDSGDPFDTIVTFLMAVENKNRGGTDNKSFNPNNTDFAEYQKAIEISAQGSQYQGESLFEQQAFAEEAKNALYYQVKDIGDKYMHSVFAGDFNKGQSNGYLDTKKIMCIDSFMNDISDIAFVDVNKLNDLIIASIGSTPSKTVIQFLSEVAESNKFLFLTFPFNKVVGDDKWERTFKPLPWGDNTTELTTENSIIFFKSNEDSFISNVGDFSDDSLSEYDASLINVHSFNVDYGRENNNIFKGVSMNMGGSVSTEESISNTLILTSSQVLGNSAFIRAGAMNLYDIYKSRSYKVSLEMMGCPNITPFMFFNLQNIPMYSGIYRIVNVSHKITANDFSTSVSGVKVNRYSINSNNELGALFTLISSTIGDLINISSSSNSLEAIIKKSDDEIRREWISANQEKYSVPFSDNKEISYNFEQYKAVNAAFRLYNPGGIKRAESAKNNHMGEYSTAGEKFRHYSDMAIGFAQYFDNISRTFIKKKITDLPNLIYMYAPPSDNNNTILYIRRVVYYLNLYYTDILGETNTTISLDSFRVSDEEGVMKAMAFAQSRVEIGRYPWKEPLFDKYMHYKDDNGCIGGISEAQTLKYNFIDAINLGWIIYKQNFEYYDIGEQTPGIRRGCLNKNEYDILNYEGILNNYYK